jgi:hypothetical protein
VEVAMTKKVSLTLLLVLALLSVPNCVRAQDSDKVVIVSPRVGSVIDAAERERYQLFPEIKGFDRAVFLQTPDKSYYAKIMFIGPDGGRKDTTVRYSEDAVSLLAEQIDRFENLKAEKYQMGDRPGKIRVVETEIKPIVLSPLIGDTLDAAERESYILLPNLKGFQGAVFYLNPDSSLKVKVTLLHNGVRGETIIKRYRSLRAVQKQISQIAGGTPATVVYRDLQEQNRRQQTLDRLRRLAEERSEREEPVTKAPKQEEMGKVVNRRLGVASGTDGRDRVVILSPRVASVIDATERERYELFPEVRGFDRAVFLQTPEKTYYAKMMLMGSDGRKETTAQYTEDQLKALAEQIEHFEDIKEGKYRVGDQPANIQLAESTMTRTENAVIPRTREAEGVDVVLLLRNGREVEGKLVSVRDSSVLIDVEDEDVPPGLSTQIRGILAIKDTMISRFALEGSSHVLLGMGLGFLGGSLVGAAGGEAVASSEKDEFSRELAATLGAGIYASIGMVAGTLVGGLIGAAASQPDIEVSPSAPAERSALKKLARYPDQEPEFLQEVK